MVEASAIEVLIVVPSSDVADSGASVVLFVVIDVDEVSSPSSVVVVPGPPGGAVICITVLVVAEGSDM